MRTYLLTLAVLISSSFGIQTAQAAFSDVPSSHPNFDAIEYVQSQNIVKGYADGTYKPDVSINRAEFLKIVSEAKFRNEIARLGLTIDCFPDVDTAEWFAKYVCFAKAKGIIGGYPDGTFKPGNTISFVEAAKIILLAFGQNIAPGDPWFKPFVEALAEQDAVPINIEDFAQLLTRGDMAEIIYRLLAGITTKTSRTYDEVAGIVTEPSGPVVKTFIISAKRFDFAPSTISVQQGDTVRLEVTSMDVKHGISIPQFGVNQVLEPGTTEIIEFVADKKGEFPFFCSVFCGTRHGEMKGLLIVE